MKKEKPWTWEIAEQGGVAAVLWACPCCEWTTTPREPNRPPAECGDCRHKRPSSKIAREAMMAAKLTAADVLDPTRAAFDLAGKFEPWMVGEA